MTMVRVTTGPMHTHPLMVTLSPLVGIHSGICGREELANDLQGVLALGRGMEADLGDQDLEMTSPIRDPAMRSTAVAFSNDGHWSVIEALVDSMWSSESNGERN